MKNMTDLELIHAYEKGEEQAATELFERYYPKTLSLCRQYFTVLADAEDVAQEVMIKVLAQKKISGYRGEGKLWTWLYRVAANACKAKLRKKAYQHWQRSQDEEILETRVVLDAQPRTVDHMLNNRMKKRLMLALWKLPSKYRQLLLSVYFQDRTYLEAAKEYQLEKATLGVRVMRAKENLQHLYLIEEKKADIPKAELFMIHFYQICQAA
jgi:RNA polymerase sigma-70 factor, ECF subfamily